ncbi:MAG: metal transporter [Alphaproteobacteria bacterium]|nr:metal transporter [Alphaproteobacteria bacterium]
MAWNRLAFGIPLLLLAVVALAVFALDPLAKFGAGLPPEEALVVERVSTGPDGIVARIRGDGRDPVQIAQVQVDGASWTFRQTPAGPLHRLATAQITVPYPWVAGETHHMRFVTSTGATFDYTIDVARTSPAADAATLFNLALLGLFVGIVPVALGMMTLPVLRRMGSEGIVFALALTIGLLAFLLVDTLSEGLELATDAASAFQADVAVWMAAALTFLGLTAISRRSNLPAGGAALATWLAIGIGFHNFGEGLSIGVALSFGNAALGSLLIVGFTVHNLTEGVAIVAPVTRRKVSLAMLAGWAAIAGLPAVAGAWIGAFTFVPHWGAVFFGIAAGAILQVMIEVGRTIWSMRGAGQENAPAGTAFAGFGAGVLVMYATAFLVQI